MPIIKQLHDFFLNSGALIFTELTLTDFFMAVLLASPLKLSVWQTHFKIRNDSGEIIPVGFFYLFVYETVIA